MYDAQVFNILCEQPETVAAYLVPRVRTIVARSQQGKYVQYLTVPRALCRFLTAPLRINRFFDAKGVPALQMSLNFSVILWCSCLPSVNALWQMGALGLTMCGYCIAGEAVYKDEHTRIVGDAARRTQRLADAAARRSHALGLAYSFSIAASYLLLVTASLPQGNLTM